MAKGRLRHAVPVPKQVDHEQRRRQIADALWRVVGSGGFDAVSLRRVAAAAGISMGLVQHYFGSREQMLGFAMDEVEERVGRRWAAELARLPDPPPPRAAVRAFLVQVLPLDATRRDEAFSLFAFVAEGVRAGPIGDRMRTGMAQLHEFVTAQVGAAGAVPDPGLAATTLIAVADGLAAHLLGGYLDAGQAVRVLDAQLDLVFGPDPGP